MTGAVVSDARLHVILNEEMQSCTWCETEEVATWAHSAWSCSAFEETRPTQPDDAMQRVLGWPCASPSQTRPPFAAIRADGSVVTWGDADYGGDSSDVQERLKNVKQIQHSHGGVFAAILADGSVVTWGNVEAGGDSSAVQEQLQNVQQIQAANRAFAAILVGGSVQATGYAGYAFAAILANGSVVFAALLGNGSSVTWGDAATGGDSSDVQEQLKNAQQILASPARGFAATLTGGSVVTWGGADFGGDSEEELSTCDTMAKKKLWALRHMVQARSPFIDTESVGKRAGYEEENRQESRDAKRRRVGDRPVDDLSDIP
eukprot:s904_g5.t1